AAGVAEEDVDALVEERLADDVGADPRPPPRPRIVEHRLAGLFDRRRARGPVAGDMAPARVGARRRRTRRLRRWTLRHRHRSLPIPASSKQKTLATRRGSLRSSVVRRLASVPPRSSVLPPGAGNKPEKAVQPKKERAKNPDERRVVEAGVHWHGQAAAVGRHDDGNMAAITAVEHVQSVLPQDASRVRLPGSRAGSLRGPARSRNPPDPTAPHRGRTPPTGWRQPDLTTSRRFLGRGLESRPSDADP